jgi:GWxTD domain-containing protein
VRRLVAVAVLTAATAALADTPPRSWRDGPVRYLLTREEYQRYGRLRTPEAREVWVERFWRRLDPDPATPVNEFRDRFEKRAAETDRFREPLTPGWRSDRGRVLLLAGAPSAVRRDAHDAYASAREIWTYAAEPTRSASPIEVVFYRDQQGRFRLEPERYAPRPSDPLESMVLLLRNPGMRPEDVRSMVDQIRASHIRTRPWPADASRTEPAHVPPPPPPPAQTDVPSALRTGAWFFQAADGSVVALFAVDAPQHAPAAQAGVWIWSTAEEAGGGSLHVPLTPADDSGAAQGRQRFTGRAYLEPGGYELRFAVQEAGAETLRVHGQRLDVPELGMGALSASSVVPAERFGPAPTGRSSIFAVGSEEVVPRPNATFHRSEPLRLYFQLYGAEPDENTLRPRVDLRVRFSAVSGRRRVGDPFVVRGASGASMGLSLPVGNWPAGDYEAQIDLHDRVSGQRASTTGRFRIED